MDPLHYPSMEGSLWQVTFRVEHDCPLARLSREVDAEMVVWSGHRFEVVTFQGMRSWTAALEPIRRILRPVRELQTPDGGMVVWHPDVEPKTSISRLLERADMMWQQPMRVVDGWEHYDAISFGEREQDALDELRGDHTTQVVRRKRIRPEDVMATLFMSLQPALESPTDKQAEALLSAHTQGYYRSPRGTTTAGVAATLGITRSSFEERLRGGENRVMERVLPALRWQRGEAGDPAG